MATFHLDQFLVGPWGLINDVCHVQWMSFLCYTFHGWISFNKIIIIMLHDFFLFLGKIQEFLSNKTAQYLEFVLDLSRTSKNILKTACVICCLKRFKPIVCFYFHAIYMARRERESAKLTLITTVPST